MNSVILILAALYAILAMNVAGQAGLLAIIMIPDKHKFSQVACLIVLSVTMGLVCAWCAYQVQCDNLTCGLKAIPLHPTVLAAIFGIVAFLSTWISFLVAKWKSTTQTGVYSKRKDKE